MGFIKKLFIEEPEGDEQYEPTEISYDDTDVDVELDSVNADTLIDDIYAQNDLYDKGKSIFKVEELINSLPKEMVTETKKASVLAILESFGLTATDVNLDGESRIEVLRGVVNKIIEDGEQEVSEKTSEIEDHKKEIARLEKEISDKQEEISISDDKVNQEILRISDLIKFIGGAD